MNKKKILIVCTNADLAGAPSHVRDLSLRLKNLEWSIQVVFGENGPTKSILDENKIPTHLISSLRSNINVFDDIKSYKKLKIIVESVKPDLIHVHSSKASFIGRLVGFSLKIPVIYTVHGWGFGKGRKPLISIFVYIIELLLSQITEHYINVCKSDLMLGKKSLPINSLRVSLIYNSTNFSILPKIRHNSKINLIMVARNDYPKDYITLFKSLSTVKVDNVLIVGSGTDHKEFKKLAAKYSKENYRKIKFMGERSNIEELLEKSTIFVLSTKVEGLPISIIEAMTKGLPIIASSVGGIPELVSHEINGLLFQQGNYNDLSKKINLLSNCKKSRFKYGLASLELAKKRFDKDKSFEQTVKIYKKSLMDKTNETV